MAVWSARSMKSISSHKREHTLKRGIATADRLLTIGAQASTNFTRARLAIFLTGFFTCLALYKAEWFHSGNFALLGFLILFLTITYYHGALKDRLHRLELWKKIKSSNLARLRLDWQDIPTHSLPTPTEHPYANDLDITGPQSLLHLLDTTISRPGQHRLAQWVLDENENPLSISDWTHRQNLVQEITQLQLLRDRITLEAQLVSEKPLDGNRIHTILEHRIEVPHLNYRLSISVGLCILTFLLGMSSAVFGIPGYWVLSFSLYVVLYFYTAGYFEPLFGRVQSLHHELEKLVAVIHLLKNRRFTDQPHLNQLCEPFLIDEDRPAIAIKQLAGICSGLSIKAHPLVHILVNALMPWDLFYVHRLEKTCNRLQSTLPLWMDRLATLDAASALGTFAHLNPDYTWPTLEQCSSPQVEAGFTAKTIGHPLIPAKRRVRNSLGFRELGKVLLVTGSNMSGKSTFLRTIGINICLAQAGAPVCAESFAWTWLRLFCCIRVTDSLAEGLSYFYAEVKRLKVVLDAVKETHNHPVLFLIDEIYKGTNNRERLGGSQAFIQALQTGNGLGLLSTHDLELAQLETNGSRVSNVHFQETVEEGQLQFDYQLRPGPCPTTNALRIMAQEGLPIPKESL